MATNAVLEGERLIRGVSEKCINGIAGLLDVEVGRRTEKLKARLIGVERDRDAIRQECENVRREFKRVTEELGASRGLVATLDDQLAEAKAAEKALKRALAKKARVDAADDDDDA